MRKLDRESSSNRKGAGPVPEGQADLLVEWRESGRITDTQFETFVRRLPYRGQK